MQVDSDAMLEAVKNNFGGVDPLQELSKRIKEMNAAELRKLIMVSCNQIGTCVKQGEYDDAFDSILHINIGADILLKAYDNALNSILEENPAVGSA